MSDADPMGELYVEQAVADLPDEPDRSSFAVTREGIFEFVESASGWQPIQYGSTEAPIPRLTVQEATVGTEPTGRPMISNGDRTLFVDPRNGDDGGNGTEDDPLATIQAAVDRVPIYLRDQYLIDIATVPDTPVTYDEDVLIPTVIGTGRGGKEVDAEGAGPFLNLVLRGNRDDPGAVSIGSVTFGNLLGTSVGSLSGATLLRDNPFDDEGYGVAAYGDGEIRVVDLTFGSGPTNGVLAYGARMKANRLDFGEGNLAIGMKAKRHASVVVHEPTGSVASDGFRATANSTISIVKDRSVSGDPLFNTVRGGLIYDDVSNSWVGMSGNDSVDELAAETEGNSQRLAMKREAQETRTPGDVWYEDGTGTLEEGFYGRTKGDTRRLD